MSRSESITSPFANNGVNQHITLLRDFVTRFEQSLSDLEGDQRLANDHLSKQRAVLEESVENLQTEERKLEERAASLTKLEAAYQVREMSLAEKQRLHQEEMDSVASRLEQLGQREVALQEAEASQKEFSRVSWYNALSKQVEQLKSENGLLRKSNFRKQSTVEQNEKIASSTVDNDKVENCEKVAAEDTVVQSISEDTVVQAVSEDTVVQSISEDTVVQAVSEDTVVQSISEDTVVQAVSEDTVVQAVSEDTVVQAVSEDTVVQAVSGTLSNMTEWMTEKHH